MNNNNNNTEHNLCEIHKKVEECPDEKTLILAKIEEETPSLTHFTPDKEQSHLLKNSKRNGKLKFARPKAQVYKSAMKIQKFARWKKRLFNLAVVLVLGIATGAVLGGWYKNYTDSMFNSNMYPTDIAPYLDNTDDILASALNVVNPSEETKKVFADTLKAQGKTPLDFSASENYALATYKASLADSFYLVSRGSVTTMGISQSVFSIRAYDGNTYELTSQSKGLLTLGICAVYNKGGNNVKLIQGKNIKDETADWTGESKNYTTEEFVEVNGSLPNVLSPYIVSSKTIKNEDEIEITYTTFNEKPVYCFEMKLDAAPAAARYYKQVKLTSGLEDFPLFKNISIKSYIDEDWNFVRTEITENYTVKYGIATNCAGTLGIDYTFNEPVILPY